MSTLPDNIIQKLQVSSICQLLYLSYLKMGNSGSFREFADECWNCYRIVRNKFMHTKLLLAIFICYTNLSAQGLILEPDSSAFAGWRLDSTKWVVHDTVFSAKVKCDHSWVYQSDSSRYLVGGFITDVSNQTKPPFWQQDKSDDTWFYHNQRKICRACLTEISEHLVKYWHYVLPPKSEFEILKDRQKSLTKSKTK